ncbi:MAG: peptidase C14 [Methylococcaceae bacterium]|nr:peptidase C14 [Methylococcaceae bacterium]
MLPKGFCLFLFITLSAGCQTNPDSSLDGKATEGFSPQETDKLFVVDCLLPSQIRKLGSQMTYLSTRRPIKTTAGDCEIRGGEYVAYDRANYASALKIWLPQAKQGDAEAQVTLGEIYEKGLGGGAADPALAAQWYLKAAEQGNSRAQVNLGYLYEKGLGVKKDKTIALNWYRKASGLENSDLQFASVTEANVSGDYQKQLQELRDESKEYQQQAVSLRKQLDATRQQLSGQQQKLSTIRNQLDDARRKLEQEKSKSHRNDALIQSLEKDVKNNVSSLSAQQSRVTQLESELKAGQKKIHTISNETASNTDDNQQPATESPRSTEPLQERLKTLETEYHNLSMQIKMDMNEVADKSKLAETTQQKLAVEKLRSKLNHKKDDLLTKGQQINELKATIAGTEPLLADQGNQQNTTLAQNGPVINIIDPPMTMTRGLPSYQLRSIARSKKILGKVGSVDVLKTLNINGQTIPVDADGKFQSEIAIENALTQVKVVATDKQGKSSMLTFNLLAKNQEDQQSTTNQPINASSASYPSVDFGRFYALIIGNNQYTHLSTLQTSANDAKAVEEVLRTRYGYKTKLLINASRYQIMSAFNNLRQILTEKDNLLIYYAGHGEIDKSDQSAYWLPTDAEANNNANWLSSYSITEYLSILAARHILVVADSCYAGAMTETAIVRLPEEMPEDKREKWLKFMNNRKARTVMTSGGVNPVLDSGSGSHSIFANAFLNALKSNNGLLEDYELFRRVAGKVKQSAAQVGFQQSPRYSAMQHAGHEGSPFFFVPQKG